MLDEPPSGRVESTPVADDEVLLRRYSRHRPDHLHDEDGSSPRLRSGALRFDSDGECSCFRAHVLDAYAIPHAEVRHADFPDIARWRAAAVRGIRTSVRDQEVQPFDVEAAPWPDGADDAPRVDVAHANITQHSYGTNPDKKARTALAQIAQVAVDTRS